MATIPLLDLNRQYEQINNEIQPAIAGVFERGDFILGVGVDTFEQAFAKYCGAAHCVAVNSGTSALIIALRTIGVGSGDEVLLPAHTFIATAEAVHYVGATPVFVDIDPETYLIDIADAEKKITPRTKVIIPVHLYGNMVPMGAVCVLAEKYNIIILEDACQAHGATQDAKQAGSFGLIGAFSFYPGKNLGAYGEGGALVTNDDRIAHEARALRNHGCHERYVHTMMGYNMRMDGIQGAVLAAKLKYLDKWNAARATHAHSYRAELSGVGDIQFSKIHEANISNNHLFVIQTARRDELQTYLKNKDIVTGIHYPIPIHLQDAFKYLGLLSGYLPQTERVCKRILSLPLFPEMTVEERMYVIQCIKEFFRLDIE